MTEKETIRRGYDNLGGIYADGRSEDGTDIAILDDFLDSVPDQSRILDAGCGPGNPILRGVSHVATAVGLDFSRRQLHLAAENAPRASLVQGDMGALPFSDASFDAIVAYHSLIHVPMEHHQTVIDAFARVLQPGGRLLLSEGPEEWRGSNPDWLESGVEMQWNIAGEAATRSHLENADFRITDQWDSKADEEEGEHWLFFGAKLDR